MTTDLSHLYRLVARAELERDQALQRAAQAERTLQEWIHWHTTGEEFPKTMRLLGLPIDEVRELYEIVQEGRHLKMTSTPHD
jgi:hypothetical protein